MEGGCFRATAEPDACMERSTENQNEFVRVPCPQLFGTITHVLSFFFSSHPKKKFGGQLKAFLWKCTKKNQHKYDNKLFPVHRNYLVVASSQICQQLFYKEADISVFNSRYDAGANKSELVVETTHPALSELKFLLSHMCCTQSAVRTWLFTPAHPWMCL